MTANGQAKGAVPCYIAGLSVDPASFHPGHAARKAVEDALAIAPGLEEVLTDMGISQLGEAFVRPMHELGLDVIRDLKSNEAQMKVIDCRHRQASPTPAHRGRDVLPDVAAQEVQAGS